LQTTLFPAYTDHRFQIFLKTTELGQLYQAIPFKELAAPFQQYKNVHPQGVKAIFSIEGGIALQFLKHYLQLSDAKLIARVNTDWQLQMFCGVNIPAVEPVRDKDIVGRWRMFLALNGDWEKLQDIFVSHWKGHMSQTHMRMDDATVFESYIKFPTDQKLLWDCIEWVWKELLALCERAGMKPPRWKYERQRQRQTAFAKRKKKTYKQRRKRSGELLRALQHVLQLLQQTLNRGKGVIREVKAGFFERLRRVKTILAQQNYHHEYPEKSVPGRIVSLYKPYLRPIVRGKENKPVEFGAKVHLSQVDGINLVEHLSFDAYHEGIRLWRSVLKHQAQFGTLKQYAGDQLYATNANRRFLKKKGVATCFKKKGNDAADTAQQAAQMRSILGKARATRLEGSFGNEKNHYLLHKVKARTQPTEVFWIFFGIHAANALLIGRRMNPLHKLQARGQPEKTAQAA
jgi:transposase, IS5 family